MNWIVLPARTIRYDRAYRRHFHCRRLPPGLHELHGRSLPLDSSNTMIFRVAYIQSRTVTGTPILSRHQTTPLSCRYHPRDQYCRRTSHQTDDDTVSVSVSCGCGDGGGGGGGGGGGIDVSNCCRISNVQARRMDRINTNGIRATKICSSYA